MFSLRPRWSTTLTLACLVALAIGAPSVRAQARMTGRLPITVMRPGASAVAAPVAAPAVPSQMRTGTPITIPSVAAQSINPLFRIAPNLTLPQAAFNTTVLGQAFRSIPPYALGFSPYPQLAFAGTGYPVVSPYMALGYGYGSPIMSPIAYDASYAALSLASPYSGVSGSIAAPYASGQSNYSSPGSSNSPVSNPRLVSPDSPPTLVSSSRPERPDSTRDVWLYDDFFSPSLTMVPAGTTVRWINYGYSAHSVTSQDGVWDSGTLRRGAEFSITFKSPGTYSYSSGSQPGGISGTIIVTK